MPALACVSPRILKRVLELDGFSVRHEDDYNWALMRDDIEEVIIIPKLGELVALDVMMGAMDAAQMNNGRYFELLPKAQKELSGWSRLDDGL